MGEIKISPSTKLYFSLKETKDQSSFVGRIESITIFTANVKLFEDKIPTINFWIESHETLVN